MRHWTIVRRLAFSALYSLFLVCSVGLICYLFFYQRWIRGLRESPIRLQEPHSTIRRHVGAEVEQLVGWFHTPRRGSFALARREKNAGVIRLCALGDSFTYGSEVPPGHDYPTLLGEMLAREGYRIEALNFGTNWWGFHQTFILWDRVARDFGCDYLLLGPTTFYPERDTAFNHTDLLAPYRLHARYVLAGESLELITVPGATAEERFAHYFRFLQPWRYLRFDRNAPTFLQCMLPRNRRLANPFYYHDGPLSLEAELTYEILLRRMAQGSAADGTAILLGSYWSHIAELAGRVDEPNLAVFMPYRPMVFPYLAAQNHNSSWGNRVLARQYGAVVTGISEPWTEILVTTRPKTVGRAIAGEDPARPVSSYAQARFETNGAVFGEFGIPGVTTGRTAPDLLASFDYVSLLSLTGPGQSPLDGAFLGLAKVITSTTAATLRLEGSYGERELSVGPVSRADPSVNLGFIELQGLRFNHLGDFHLHPSALLPADDLAATDRITLEVAGERLLQGRAGPGGGSFHLVPVTGTALNVRVQLAELPVPHRIDEGDTVELVLETPDGIENRLAIGTWHRRRVVLKTPLRTLGTGLPLHRRLRSWRPARDVYEPVKRKCLRKPASAPLVSLLGGCTGRRQANRAGPA